MVHAASVRLMVWMAVGLAAAPGCGGEEGGARVGEEQAPAAAAPGQTTFVRKLGGAGWELAKPNGLTVGADGSLVAFSDIGDPSTALGATRIDAAGRTLWSRTWATGRTAVWLDGSARSPLGNVLLAVTPDGPGVDLGGGELRGPSVVKLAPDGRFVWMQALDGPLASGVAVDGTGHVLAGWTGDVPTMNRYLWDGTLLGAYALDHTSQHGDAEVAFDPAGDLVGASGLSIEKLGVDHARRWRVELAGAGYVTQVATTAKGTVVVAGWFAGPLTLGAERIEAPDGGGFIAVIEADGRPRWLRRMSGFGPIAVHPEGRLAVLAWDFTDRCRDAVERWDLTGKVLWRRPVVRCPGSHGAQSVNVAVAPDHAIWVQGHAWAPFDAGTGTLTPAAGDWFLVRIAP